MCKKILVSVKKQPKAVVCIQSEVIKEMSNKCWEVQPELIPKAVEFHFSRGEDKARARQAPIKRFSDEFKISRASAKLFIKTLESYVDTFKPRIVETPAYGV